MPVWLPWKKCWMWSVKGCSIGKHLDNLKHGGGFKHRTVSIQGFRIVGYDMFFFHRWLECPMWKMEGGRIRGQSTFCWPWMGPANKGRILWFLRYFHLIRVRFSFATFLWQLLLPFVAFRFLPNKTLVTSGLIHSAFGVCTIKKEPVNYDWFSKSSRNAYLLAGPNRYQKHTKEDPGWKTKFPPLDVPITFRSTLFLSLDLEGSGLIFD